MDSKVDSFSQTNQPMKALVLTATVDNRTRDIAQNAYCALDIYLQRRTFLDMTYCSLLFIDAQKAA